MNDCPIRLSVSTTVVAIVEAGVFALTPLAVRAETLDISLCKPIPSAISAERIRQEATRGMPSFRRFVARTKTVYQIDFATEVAKLDAREACETAHAATTATALTSTGATPLSR